MIFGNCATSNKSADFKCPSLSSFAVLIDADAYPDIARKYGLEAVPLTVLYLEGMKLKDMVGGITAPRLNELIEQTIRVQ